MDDRPDGKLHQFLWFLGWPLRQLLILGVRFYKKWISPGLPSSCRYYPTCSTYAVESLQRHGVLKGVALASWRILKCNPFSEGGVNPVPANGKWRSEVGPDGELRESQIDSGQVRNEAMTDDATRDAESRDGSDSDPVAEMHTDSGQTRPTTITTLGV